MKAPGIILAAAALMAGTACSTLKTTADYEPGTDFSKFHTFAVKEVDSTRNELLERRIRRALESGLLARGLQKDEAAPDLWVVPHARLSHETEIRTYNTGWGYGWRRGFGTGVAHVRNVPVGTLIVDLVDAKEKELVWRGTASDTLKQGATPAEKEEALSRAVTRMLEAFPPTR